jgi:hypothetical protein
MSPRSENDWRALERAERLGHEPPARSKDCARRRVVVLWQLPDLTTTIV